MSDRKIKLFISHASEDKEVFVQELAAALKRNCEFEVWYDDYSLRLGDSLSGSITTGLRLCDYGIVVLSPDFFSKKWTANELAGLFAQETEERKVILPILHNVTVEDVQKCNPILADRKAISSTKPLEEIVFEIEFATGVSRSQPLVAEIRNEILERNANEELSSSIEGRHLIEASVYDVYDRFEQLINEIQASLKIEICYLHEMTPPIQSNVPDVVTLPPPPVVTLPLLPPRPQAPLLQCKSIRTIPILCGDRIRYR